MDVWVGTSGWQYADWRGPFYPKGVPQRRWLGHYTTAFPVVEVNATFYRLPAPSTVDRWAEQTPDGFRLVWKASRYLTHIRRLREPREPVERLWSLATRLGAKLGPVLFQFPPNFPAEPELLRGLLAVLPAELRGAFEFRDPSWERDDVLSMLEGAGAAWVLADRPRARVREVVTGGWTYLRFHQGRASSPGYPREKLRRWADRIAALPAEEAYVFFNNDHRAAAPADAVTLRELLRRRGANVPGPRDGEAARVVP